MPPVDVPTMRSKYSCSGLPTCLSISAKKAAGIMPFRPPPSMVRMRRWIAVIVVVYLSRNAVEQSWWDGFRPRTTRHRQAKARSNAATRTSKGWSSRRAIGPCTTRHSQACIDRALLFLCHRRRCVGAFCRAPRPAGRAEARTYRRRVTPAGVQSGNDNRAPRETGRRRTQIGASSATTRGTSHRGAPSQRAAFVERPGVGAVASMSFSGRDRRSDVACSQG